jgi:hypothetical protein
MYGESSFFLTHVLRKIKKKNRKGNKTMVIKFQRGRNAYNRPTESASMEL